MARLTHRYAASLALPALVACGAGQQQPAAPVNAAATPAQSSVAAPSSPSPLTDPSLPKLPMLRVEGPRIVDAQGSAVRLIGVAFGNEVWGNVPVPSGHHSETDFERLANMGMNSVRFYLNYRTFEDDAAPGNYKQSGWDWLEKNIAWARRHGVYLVLNMHAPAGGYQSLGKGVALWSEPAMQARYIALWRAIAERYAGEGAIAGYDILNEPVPNQSKGQWRELAERTVKAIREVDAKHMVFVERVNAVGGDWSEDADSNFFRVSDPNVVYEFHFYKPFHFTHQSAFWTDFAAREGKYPDESIAEVEWYLVNWKKEAKSKKLPAGDSDWAYYAGESFTVNDPALVVGKPVLACDQNAGTASFDGLVLERVGKGGKAEKLWERDLDTRRGWYFWTQDGSGAGEVSGEGHGDKTALTISATKSSANLAADPLRFRLEPGKTYRLSGWMKGKGISKDAACTIRLNLGASPVPVHARGKDYLRQVLDTYVAWGKRENVPLYLGEFGTIRGSFDGDLGGLRWTTDMLDLLNERQLSYAYHAYHEQNFGIFFGDGSLPDPKNANTALLELLRQKVKPEAPAATPAAPAPAVPAPSTSPVSSATPAPAPLAPTTAAPASATR